MITTIIKKVRKLKDPGSQGEKRSGQWPKVRKEHLEKNPACAACGGNNKIEVHHCEPFHLDPSKELDENNLITLCEANKWLNCHLCLGHGGSYKAFNPDVRKDAKRMNDMLTNKQS